MKNQSLAFLENVATFETSNTALCLQKSHQKSKPRANWYPIRLTSIYMELFGPPEVLLFQKMKSPNSNSLNPGIDGKQNNQLWDRIQEQSELIHLLKTKIASQKRLIEFYVHNPRKEDLSWN